MPQIPPGSGRRKHYSDRLESTGSLIEQRYKQHQLEDTSHLQRQADNFVSRVINNGETKIPPTLPQIEGVAVPLPPVVKLEGNDHHRSDVNRESSSCTPTSQSAFQEFDESKKNCYNSPTLKTKVVLDIPIPTGERDLEENKPPSTAGSSVEGTVIIEKVFSPVNEVGKWCLVAQTIISVLLLVMCLLLVLLDFGQDLRTFVIVYPFVVYYLVRIIVVDICDFVLERYVLVNYPQIAAPSNNDVKVRRGRVFRGLVNNLCLIGSVAAAVLPYGNTYGALPVSAVKVIYFSLIAFIHGTIFLATALHYGMIHLPKRQTRVTVM